MLTDVTQVSDLVDTSSVGFGGGQVEVGPPAIDGDHVVDRVWLGDDVAGTSQLVNVHCKSTE